MILYLTKPDETKLRIFHAFDRNIEDLTVDSICRKAGVSRPTFYHHFSSKYDVAVWSGIFICRQTVDQIGRTLTWEEGLRAYFELGISELTHLGYMRARAEAYEKIVQARVDHRCNTIEETMLSRGAEVSALMRRVIKGYVKVEQHLSEERTEPGQSQDVDEIVKMTLSFTPPVLYEALREPMAKGPRSAPGHGPL